MSAVNNIRTGACKSVIPVVLVAAILLGACAGERDPVAATCREWWIFYDDVISNKIEPPEFEHRTEKIAELGAEAAPALQEASRELHRVTLSRVIGLGRAFAWLTMQDLCSEYGDPFRTSTTTP